MQNRILINLNVTARYPATVGATIAKVPEKKASIVAILGRFARPTISILMLVRRAKGVQHISKPPQTNSGIFNFQFV